MCFGGGGMSYSPPPLIQPPQPPPPAPPPTEVARKVEPAMDNAGRDAGEKRLSSMKRGRNALRIDVSQYPESGLNVQS